MQLFISYGEPARLVGHMNRNFTPERRERSGGWVVVPGNREQRHKNDILKQGASILKLKICEKESYI